MKKMKRICSMLLCMSLAFAFAACGSSTQEETSASADAEEVTFAAYTDEAAEALGSDSITEEEFISEAQAQIEEAAYTETVTTGYKCSTCGATK